MSDELYQRFSDRFFQVSPLYTRPGWYIKLREGDVMGPYQSKEAAQAALLSLFGMVDCNEKNLLQSAEAIVRYSPNSRNKQ